jgi:hypothetical protein
MAAKVKVEGMHTVFQDIFSLIENCKISKYLYLQIIVRKSNTTKMDLPEGANVKVIYRYQEKGGITIADNINDFMNMSKEAFMNKMDEVKAAVDEMVKDEPSNWTKEKYTVNEKLKDAFWAFYFNVRSDIKQTSDKVIALNR